MKKRTPVIFGVVVAIGLVIAIGGFIPVTHSPESDDESEDVDLTSRRWYCSRIQGELAVSRLRGWLNCRR
ncbi:MAG: hypothetical protein ACOC2V_01190, partial [Alkalispirochaeta sp.]